MLQLQRLHEETAYTTMTNSQYATYCRRTFWLLFITERAYGIQRHRSLTLQDTIDFPTIEPGPEATILSGFLDLVSLFQNSDSVFLSLWKFASARFPPLGSLSFSPDCKTFSNFSIPNLSERTEIQQADLLVSRQWLKIKVWELCARNGLLSSSFFTGDSMSFDFPVTVVRDVVHISRNLPQMAVRPMGLASSKSCSISEAAWLILWLYTQYARRPEG